MGSDPVTDLALLVGSFAVSGGDLPRHGWVAGPVAVKLGSLDKSGAISGRSFVSNPRIGLEALFVGGFVSAVRLLVLVRQNRVCARMDS